MNSFRKIFMFLNAILIMTSCKEPKKEEVKINFIDVPYPGIYEDRDGVRWSKDNIFAPKAHESLNDPNYKKRMESINKSYSNDDNQYEKGYQKGYNDAKHKYNLK